MIVTGKIDGIFYNANDTKICPWHSFRERDVLMNMFN